MRLLFLIPLGLLIGCSPKSEQIAQNCPRTEMQWFYYPDPPPPKTPFVIPATELLYKGNLEQAETGLIEWSRHNYMALVTTYPEMVDVFGRLRDAAPATVIIPGFRTERDLVGIDDVEGWQKVAEAVCEAREAHGSVWFALDVAVTLYRDNRPTFRANDLAEGLEGLPDNFSYIWIPGIINREVYPKRATRIDEATKIAAQALGNRVHFVSYLHHTPRNPYFTYENHHRICYIAAQEEVPSDQVLYFMNGVAWSEADLEGKLEEIGNSVVLLNSHVNQWTFDAQAYLGSSVLDLETGRITDTHEVP